MRFEDIPELIKIGEAEKEHLLLQTYDPANRERLQWLNEKIARVNAELFQLYRIRRMN